MKKPFETQKSLVFSVVSSINRNHSFKVERNEKKKERYISLIPENALKYLRKMYKKYTSDDDAANDIQTKLNNKVHVIWYEVDSSENSTQLFTRLNIGKIPLTNAELVKALFLCQTDQVTKSKQMEISLQWDTIERELHDDDL